MPISIPNPRTSKNYQKIQVEPPEHSRIDVVSINWCDPTTWYPDSVSASGTLTDSGDHQTFNFPHTNIIDVTNGKLSGERKIRATYAPWVSASGVSKIENPTGTTNGDFTIDYSSGTLAFNGPLTSGTEVTASYYYENGSSWILKPDPGKHIRITAVEVQFSTDIDLTDSIIFEAYGLVDYFAPNLIPLIPAGTVIPLGNQIVYQTMQDYINDAEYAYPTIPAMGGSSWRGMSCPIHIFRWPYQDRGTTDLKSSQGVELRIKLENNIPLSGTVGIATFYGIPENEE